MEGGKQSGSSLASDLFGAKDSSPSASASSGLFGSIFAPPRKVSGMESLHSPKTDKNKYDPAWSAKTEIAADKNNASEGQMNNSSSYYNQEERLLPLNYSSSIYYGGQDVYSRPQDPQNTFFTTFNKDGGEDDSGGASRGNWWQGSLYY
ncbi:uncharacterized protein LOC127251331 [Andrographis paniculata]|uniref:uncharacterized protein LOC127251331 n=1 Tax=Andrographis paniculata TaxID=175694 RepID=UPI0021E8A1BE|nr:uncharacterized protein LOC127251331 [Andrographis paniculata]